MYKVLFRARALSRSPFVDDTCNIFTKVAPLLHLPSELVEARLRLKWEREEERSVRCSCVKSNFKLKSSKQLN